MHSRSCDGRPFPDRQEERCGEVCVNIAFVRMSDSNALVEVKIAPSDVVVMGFLILQLHL